MVFFVFLPRSRNNEKRKEKSRDAARTRRSRETEIFTDLGEALPLAKEEVEQLDKASVMRLAIAYLKVRGMVDTVGIRQEEKSEEEEEKAQQQQQVEEDIKPTLDALLGNESEQTLIKALDGFLLVLSEEGDITYVSENVTDLLGLQQVRDAHSLVLGLNWRMIDGSLWMFFYIIMLYPCKCVECRQF